VITDAHRVVAELFFALPEADGYVVGGGVAVLAHRVVDAQRTG